MRCDYIDIRRFKTFHQRAKNLRSILIPSRYAFNKACSPSGILSKFRRFLFVCLGLILNVSFVGWHRTDPEKWFLPRFQSPRGRLLLILFIIKDIDVAYCVKILHNLLRLSILLWLLLWYVCLWDSAIFDPSHGWGQALSSIASLWMRHLIP